MSWAILPRSVDAMLKATLSISSVATALPSRLMSFSIVLAVEIKRRISGQRVLGVLGAISLSRLAARCGFPNLHMEN